MSGCWGAGARGGLLREGRNCGAMRGLPALLREGMATHARAPSAAASAVAGAARCCCCCCCLGRPGNRPNRLCRSQWQCRRQEEAPRYHKDGQESVKLSLTSEFSYSGGASTSTA